MWYIGRGRGREFVPGLWFNIKMLHQICIFHFEFKIKNFLIENLVVNFPTSIQRSLFNGCTLTCALHNIVHVTPITVTQSICCLFRCLFKMTLKKTWQIQITGFQPMKSCVKKSLFAGYDFNSLWPSNAILHHTDWLSLVQIMACPLFGSEPSTESMITYCQLNLQWNMKQNI